MSKNYDAIIFALGAIAGGALMSLVNDKKRKSMEELDRMFEESKNKARNMTEKEIQDSIDAMEKFPNEIKNPLNEIFEETFGKEGVFHI